LQALSFFDDLNDPLSEDIKVGLHAAQRREFVMSSLHDIEVKTIDGEPKPLAAYAGKALLIVNVASKCGFTPQYQGLEALYRQYKDRGFAVLGFPCDQFGHQEPGNEADIRNFCSLTYEVSFPLFSKIEVNGPGAHPLYQHLKKAMPGLLGTEGIKWNFTKFLVDPQGKVVARYAPTDKPAGLAKSIEALLPTRP
jgi:glutathione peroxidase